MVTNTAPVQEIFSGIQGEGPMVGMRQIFVRFFGCNLSCIYCDTPASRLPQESARIEQTAGERDFVLHRNPLSTGFLSESILRLSSRHAPWVSLTGGEPLLHAAFLLELLPLLKDAGAKIYLETNGTLPAEMEKIAVLTDFTAMDIKLPSASGQGDLFELHRAFLRACRADRAPERFCVKIVLTDETDSIELNRAADLISSINPCIPLILQPATTTSPEVSPPLPDQLLRWQTDLMKILKDVRVIPQTHKIINQL
ncbi:MAG: 7-carboxy-7-deazaguanine synthase QueE [bacterium]